MSIIIKKDLSDDTDDSTFIAKVHWPIPFTQKSLFGSCKKLVNLALSFSQINGHKRLRLYNG